MQAQLSDIDRVRRPISDLLGDDVRIAALASGTTGRSFRLDWRQQQFVAKFFDTDANVLLGPAAQFELLRQLAPSGVAPRPVAVDDHAGLLITEYVGESSASDPSWIKDSRNIDAIAGVLRTLHGSGVEVPVRLDLLQVVSGYIDRAGGPACLTAADERLFDELTELSAKSLRSTNCICHNDLVSENLMLGARPGLIDFDYAVMSEPILDLASVTVMNEFDRAAETLLVEAYRANRDLPFSPAEFARVQRVVRLLAHFWSLASPDNGDAKILRYRIRND